MSMQRNEKFREQYDKIILEHPELLSLESDQERCKQLVILSDVIMGEICTKADEIKINAFEIIENDYKHLGIPQPVWLELVELQRLKLHGNLPDGVLDKIAQSYIGAKNVTALRESLIENIAEGSKVYETVSIDTPKQLTYERDETINEEFNALLTRCADTRHYLDSVLWPKLRLYGDAFTYLSSEPYAVFKFLLDMWHYRNGGWPSEKTPPRSFSIVKRFSEAFRALDRFGFDFANDWCRGFGLDVQVRDHSPALHHWNDIGYAWRQFRMFKFIPEHAPQGIEDYHHCVADIDGKVALVYLWDTREIIDVIDVSQLQWSHTHTHYGDSLQSLNPVSGLDKSVAETFKAILQ